MERNIFKIPGSLPSMIFPLFSSQWSPPWPSQPPRRPRSLARTTHTVGSPSQIRREGSSWPLPRRVFRRPSWWLRWTPSFSSMGTGYPPFNWGEDHSTILVRSLRKSNILTLIGRYLKARTNANQILKPQFLIFSWFNSENHLRKRFFGNQSTTFLKLNKSQFYLTSRECIS